MSVHGPPKIEMFYKKTIYDGEAGLHFHKGSLVEVLSPGSYSYFGKNHEIHSVSLLPSWESVGGQDVLSSDGAVFRTSVVVSYQIVDPKKAYTSGSLKLHLGKNPDDFFRFQESKSNFNFCIQIAIRQWIEPRTFSEVIESRSNFESDVRGSLEEQAREFGMGLLGIQVLDLQPSGAMRQAQAELLKTEIEGQIMLARARNEAAALRNLLNSARLVREHPKLLELRILAAGQKPKVTFVVNGGDAVGGVESPVQEDSN